MKSLLVLVITSAATLAHAGAPAKTHADAKSFVTTGGQTKLTMTVLKQTPAGMLVRFHDSTKLAFNGKQSAATVMLKRGDERQVSPGWVPFAGTATHGGWSFDITVERPGLNGSRGAKVGVNLTERDSLTRDLKLYGVHFQLAN